MNFYKHHLGDFAQATAHLTFLEDAAYSRLLRKYYAEETPIPADMKAAQRLVGARTEDEREAVETVLAEFFTLEDDGWHNKRADEEIAKANAQADTNRRIAEEREARKRARIENESATNRSEKNDEPSNDTLNESCNEPANDSFQLREPSQTPDSRLQTRARSNSLVRFAEFWAAYPVKKGKAAAEAKWKAKNLDAIADRILADVEDRKARDRQWLEGFAPHASTYVNQRGWEDEIEAVKQNGRDTPAGAYKPLPGEV